MTTKEWGIYDVRTNSTGTYYVMRQRTSGQLDACVTAKATRYDTFACLTCLVTTCKHAKFVALYAETHCGIPAPLALPPLDVTDPATLDRWCASPSYDTRTLEEFAAAGGARTIPSP